jgi:methyltransferase, FkbM family
MTKDGILHESVCEQNVTLQFQVSPNIPQPRKGTVHCFEPVPATVKRLQDASRNLRYDTKGYKVIHAAVSNTTGMDYFQSNFKAGRENGSLDDCRNNVDKPECDVQVQVLTLETYVKEHLVGNDSPIHILQIDVEGYDADVLYGAGKYVLERVEYLEFEYNWMGSWKYQHLYDVIEMLDEIGFTCYWAGKQKLWRVTGCWQLYFDVHTWSNLACANRKRVPRLAAKMENVFQMQMVDKEGAIAATSLSSTSSNHEILSSWIQL